VKAWHAAFWEMATGRLLMGMGVGKGGMGRMEQSADQLIGQPRMSGGNPGRSAYCGNTATQIKLWRHASVTRIFRSYQANPATGEMTVETDCVDTPRYL